MEELDRLRAQIDAIDEQMVPLFEQRMAISARIGVLKRESGRQVRDPQRGEELLRNRAALLRDKSLAPYADAFFEMLMDLSCRRQEALQR
ncbi:MAG: chorismate mutase [Ruthenibacterium sp.]